MKKVYAISDNLDDIIGLGLAEISAQLAETPDEVGSAIESILNTDPNAGLIIITASLAARSEELLADFRARNKLPLITVIPNA